MAFSSTRLDQIFQLLQPIMAYQYENLKSKDNEIRILKLLPSTDQSAAVCCELKIVSLNDNPIFNALSYCWADPPDPSSILLNQCDHEVKFSFFALPNTTVQSSALQI